MELTCYYCNVGMEKDEATEVEILTDEGDRKELICKQCNTCDCCSEVICTSEKDPHYFYGPNSYAALIKKACPCSACLICTACLKNTATEVALGNIYAMVSYNCGQTVGDELFRKALGEEMYAKFETWQLSRAIESLPGVRSCPACESTFQYELDPECAKRPSRDVGCPECHNRFCFDCLGKAHVGLTCAENERVLAGESVDEVINSTTGDKNFKWTTLTVIKHLAKECPKCNSKIEKNGGCNWVMCRNCKNNFCWMCVSRVAAGGEVDKSHSYCYSEMEGENLILGKLFAPDLPPEDIAGLIVEHDSYLAALPAAAEKRRLAREEEERVRRERRAEAARLRMERQNALHQAKREKRRLEQEARRAAKVEARRLREAGEDSYDLGFSIFDDESVLAAHGVEPWKQRATGSGSSAFHRTISRAYSEEPILGEGVSIFDEIDFDTYRARMSRRAVKKYEGEWVLDDLCNEEENDLFSSVISTSVSATTVEIEETNIAPIFSDEWNSTSGKEKDKGSEDMEGEEVEGEREKPQEKRKERGNMYMMWRPPQESVLTESDWVRTPEMSPALTAMA